MGTLSLEENSIVDLSGIDGSIMTWAEMVVASWDGTLQIHNWGGTTKSTKDSGHDELRFTNSTAFDDSEVVFYSGAGTGAFTGARLIDRGAYYELCPGSPEASTWVGIGMLLGLIAFVERRRRGKIKN